MKIPANMVTIPSSVMVWLLDSNYDHVDKFIGYELQEEDYRQGIDNDNWGWDIGKVVILGARVDTRELEPAGIQDGVHRVRED